MEVPFPSLPSGLLQLRSRAASSCLPLAVTAPGIGDHSVSMIGILHFSSCQDFYLSLPNLQIHPLHFHCLGDDHILLSLGAASGIWTFTWKHICSLNPVKDPIPISCVPSQPRSLILLYLFLEYIFSWAVGRHGSQSKDSE